jgi:hypothetical protein
MESILVVLGVLAGVVLFEVLAVRFGVDSRLPDSDDHRLSDGDRRKV